MFVGGAVGKSAAIVQDEPWNHCHNPDSGHALGCAWLQLCFPFSISAWKIGIQHLNTTPLSQSSRQKSDESQQVAHQKHGTTLICFHHISLPNAQKRNLAKTRTPMPSISQYRAKVPDIPRDMKRSRAITPALLAQTLWNATKHLWVHVFFYRS